MMVDAELNAEIAVDAETRMHVAAHVDPDVGSVGNWLGVAQCKDSPTPSRLQL